MSAEYMVYRYDCCIAYLSAIENGRYYVTLDASKALIFSDREAAQDAADELWALNDMEWEVVDLSAAYGESASEEF